MVSNRLKELRENNKYTQKDIANILGMRQQQYSRYEVGSREIPLDKLIVLSELYNTSLDYILNRTNQIKPYTRIIPKQTNFNKLEQRIFMPLNKREKAQ